VPIPTLGQRFAAGPKVQVIRDLTYLTMIFKVPQYCRALSATVKDKPTARPLQRICIAVAMVS